MMPQVVGRREHATISTPTRARGIHRIVSDCPSKSTWDDYRRGDIEPPRDRELKDHLDGCAACRGVMNAPAATALDGLKISFKEADEPVESQPAVTIRPTGDEDS
jgi:Putative zinc-finger